MCARKVCHAARHSLRCIIKIKIAKGGSVPLHIRAQNAGVMISKVDDSVHIEVFELSPRNRDVIETKGRLRRSFPGFAVSISACTSRDAGFQAALTSTLAKMSHQPATGTQPKVKKARKMHEEIRDTTHPKMVTELLAASLMALGGPVGVSTIWKNTREEVFWRDSLLPWRRSPMWLLTRVALQLTLSRSTAEPKASTDLYKELMVFLMADILTRSHKHHLESDLLSFMNAKLSRRLRKLDSAIGDPVRTFVHAAMRRTDAILQERWSTIQKGDTLHQSLSRLGSLKFEEDTLADLPCLNEYISSIAKRSRDRSSAIFQPTSVLAKFEADRLPKRLDFHCKEYLDFNLTSFETWVATHLWKWLDSHRDETSTCGLLRHLIQDYHATALPLYKGNAEATSVMLLTILELWLACDMSAIQVCPLLSEYDPGIPQSLLQNLVLPFREQMERLHRVEEYLVHRSCHSKYSAPHIFKAFGSWDCFPVRYFEKSLDHQKLLAEIERCATKARQKKRDELLQKKHQYNNFMMLHNQSACEYIVKLSPEGVVYDQHDKNCQKCQYKSEADSLSISIHEWPLPADALKAKSTIFELRIPESFGHWRDATVFLQLDVLEVAYASQRKPQYCCKPSTYSGLSSFSDCFSSEVCISLLSEEKPHVVTHRHEKPIATAIEKDICLENGLSYRYHDDARGCFIAEFLTTDKILKSCTYRLPARSSPLQQFLFRPAAHPSGLSPNTVIATQSQCPDHMSVEEYKALCSIPLGYRIQWQNILVQLYAPSVDFKQVETGLTILQCIQQTGPCHAGDVLRPGHVAARDDVFAHDLINGLSEALERFKENWQSSEALNTFISLATRVLSLTPSNGIKERCLVFLTNARNITLSWANLLRDKAQQAVKNEEREALRSKAITAALICARSFSIDDGVLVETLDSSESASILLQCSIIIQEGVHSSGSSDASTALLYWQWKRLCYRSYRTLAQRIVEADSGALDDAIRKSWSAYQAQGGWRRLSEKHDHWLVSRTEPKGDGDPLWVHFNLLTGQLLVNGIPLDRLPAEYERHPMYCKLFGHATIDVMLTEFPGMCFSGKREFAAGYTLYFGMSSGTGRSSEKSEGPEPDLWIRTVKNGQAFELVPPRILQSYFPTAFTENYIHWYDVANNCLEFCPHDDPWAHSPHNWKLDRAGPSGRWRLKKNGLFLVDVNSPTAKVLAEIFSALEDPLGIHAIFHESTSFLDIQLPRIQYGFSLQPGVTSIRSRQFRGMSVDEDQSIETLVGFRNKLVLKDDERPSHRMVVLLEGPVSYERSGDHVLVTTEKESAARAHAYRVDGLLGRLVDNGSLQSKLLLCYVHALTSFCLPDPLTRRTGTEEALSILGSASVKSFDRLAEENLDILEHIALLTPGRHYYPRHERVMQTVDWSPGLGFMAQHGAFYVAVRSIFDQAMESDFFHPESYVQPPGLDLEPGLLFRDSIRSSLSRVSMFGAEDHTVEQDVVYSARDRGQISSQSHRVFAMSSVIFQGLSNPHCQIPQDLTSHLWKFLSHSKEVLGPCDDLDPSELTYDARWLLDSAAFISKYWITLHQTISPQSAIINKHQLIIWLSTLAFAEKADMVVIQTLASFFNVREVAQISVPTMARFRLSEGAEVDRPQLSRAIEPTSLSLSDSPEASLARLSGESKKAYKNRRFREYTKMKGDAFRQLANALEIQWPCERPSMNSSPAWWAGYIDMDKAMTEARELFQVWYDNYRFRAYLDKISNNLPRQVLAIEMPHSPLPATKWDLRRQPGFVSADDVFSCSAPAMPQPNAPDLQWLLASVYDSNKQSPRLATLIARLETKAKSNYEKRYLENLTSSLRSLQDRQAGFCLLPVPGLKEALVRYLEYWKEHVDGIYFAMLEATSGVRIAGLELSARSTDKVPDLQQWPRLSPIFFLQCLCRGMWQKLSSGWKDYITCYGLALTKLQQAERLLASCGSTPALINELRNPGHTNWHPCDHPESLLLEIESGIMVREVQEQIAAQMRSPSTGGNVVMQLNMGEGKSSVIVPMVATSLADGSRLVRVIVAKPQAKQMFQMLVSKLGGLLNRRVYHMPFSRTVRAGEREAKAIHRILQNCKANGGILLVQPEHILSFKLMAVECAVLGKEAIGQALLACQGFLNTSSRDIVDESDENFSVKFELVYTMGMQRPTDHSPERWICIQELLDIFRKCAPGVKEGFPLSVEMHPGCPGCFPRTRILRQDAQAEIMGRVATQICETGLSGFPIARQPESVRQAVYGYITEPTVAESDEVEKQNPQESWAETTRNTQLLLRGLIAGGVLVFAFGQKRWRVDYGLDLSRRPETKLAVPYRAKDNPAARSEFSHPDVVIVLTSLSYYYGGLTDEDLFLAFDHLFKSDQADLEYQTWVQDADNLPFAFQQLGGINLEDHFQCVEKVFPCLHSAKSAIDYYLAHIVFPKEMKEFPHKLSASGWDIGEAKTHPTTGFSGTNDSRDVLPLDVEQLDLQDQKHTNALVLEHLLQPENSVALMQPSYEVGGSDAERLLAMVVEMTPPVRVILDVGAQILELDNIGVAKQWLSMLPDDEQTQAAVFFDNSDHICVLDRKGNVEPLHTSPFAKQLDVCLVFLDEVHTRGTDLRLPESSRAAVTLGANLTKDRLVQGMLDSLLPWGSQLMFVQHV